MVWRSMDGMYVCVCVCVCAPLSLLKKTLLLLARALSLSFFLSYCLECDRRIGSGLHHCHNLLRGRHVVWIIVRSLNVISVRHPLEPRTIVSVTHQKKNQTQQLSNDP